ncbi:hypothetical protein LCGC14_1544360 [marine sediment metagenome]|uniref:Uncharacterized protein n=1 Tax=marine sediment metagenome TaxID=412755 RepID=A0A0F9L876_9ZZZZ
MEFFSLAEIVTAVVMVLGGQKGFEIYKRKRHSNGGRDRRSNSGNHNSFSQGDKEFIEGCFKTQTKEMGMSMKNDRLELAILLKDIVQAEGEKTRSVVRSSR